MSEKAEYAWEIRRRLQEVEETVYEIYKELRVTENRVSFIDFDELKDMRAKERCLRTLEALNGI